MNGDIQCVFDCFGGHGAIFISDYPTAKNIDILKKHGIKAIISVAKGAILTHPEAEIPYYLYIDAEDRSQYQLSKHFPQTYQFIDQHRKNGNILVHCYAGISRSAAIVMAYLLKKYKYSVDETFSLMKRKRRKINPNPGFLQQLNREAAECQIQSKKKRSIEKSPANKRTKSTELFRKKKNQIIPQKQNQFGFPDLQLKKKTSDNSPNFIEDILQNDNKFIEVRAQRDSIEIKIEQLREKIMSYTRKKANPNEKEQINPQEKRLTKLRAQKLSRKTCKQLSQKGRDLELIANDLTSFDCNNKAKQIVLSDNIFFSKI